MWWQCHAPQIDRAFPWDDGGPHCRQSGSDIGVCAPEAFGHDPLRLAFGDPLPWTVRRGLPICHEHEDCRRSLALGVACAEGRQ